MDHFTSPLRRAAAVTLSGLFLAACGGGDSRMPFPSVPAAADVPAAVPQAGPPAETPPLRHAIGGSLSGLPAGEKLMLRLGGGDALTLTADGAFRFATPVLADTAYAVTVGRQPNWYDCTVRNGSGRATADVASVSVACAPAPARVTTLAGSGAPGHDDGVGLAASFFQPTGVAVDAGGNVYVADSVNHEIRKITPDGVVTTWVGSFAARGTADGVGTAASFNGPTGVTVHVDGSVYVADYGNQKIRAITPSGIVATLAGHLPPGAVDGTGTAASFNGPFGLSVDQGGSLYVADQSNNEIRRITPAGVVSTLAGATAAGSADGIGANASFFNPSGVAVDAAGNVYVADSLNHRIRKITPAGAVSTLAGSAAAGSADGTGANASFNGPIGIAVDASGHLYVADLNNNSIRRITPAGVVSTLAGSATPGFADGIGAAAAFRLPMGVTVDADGNLYVADWRNHAIRKISPVRS